MLPLCIMLPAWIQVLLLSSSQSIQAWSMAICMAICNPVVVTRDMGSLC